MPARFQLNMGNMQKFCLWQNFKPFSSFAGKWQTSSGAKSNMRVGDPPIKRG